MITLHGFSFSNYYNIVKHVLLYKGLEFGEDLNYGGTPEYLAISPVGKIPAITTEQGGHLSEAGVCCDYLDETYPEPPLYPADSFARNYVRQIVRMSELYIELSCRRLIPYVFQNGDAPEALQAEVNTTLDRGIPALTRLCQFDPYVAGAEMTMADIYLRYVLKVAAMCAEEKLGRDIVGEIPGLAEWVAMMDDSDIARRVDADHEANTPEFMAYLAERFGL